MTDDAEHLYVFVGLQYLFLGEFLSRFIAYQTPFVSQVVCAFFITFVKILFSKHVSLIKGILLTYASFAIL